LVAELSKKKKELANNEFNQDMHDDQSSKSAKAKG
jgi:hypothetical protein